jgi:hypothetical protein
MVGVASTVVICAILLYVVDSRDRARHEKLIESRRQEEQQKQMETTIASSGYNGTDSSSPSAILSLQPTEYVDEEIDSISRVSTMTYTSNPSIFDGPTSPSDEEDLSDDDDDDDDDLDSSLEVIELDEENRLTYDTDLSRLVDLHSIASFDERSNASKSKSGDNDDDNEELRFDSLISRDASSYLAKVAARMQDYSDDSSSEGESGWNSQSDVSSDTSLATFLTNHAASIASSRDSFSVDTPRMLEQGNVVTRLLGAPTKSSNSASDENSCVSSSTSGSANGIIDEEEEPFDASDRELEESNSSNLSVLLEGQEPTVKSEENAESLASADADASAIKTSSSGTFLENLARLQELYKPRTAASMDQNHGVEQDHKPEQYLRDIYFVPIVEIATPSLGLDILEASNEYPKISKVHEDSPLIGQVFEEDVILAINNIPTFGGDESALTMFSSLAMTEQDTCAMDLEAATAKVIKLTVLSSHVDDAIIEEEKSFEKEEGGDSIASSLSSESRTTGAVDGYNEGGSVMVKHSEEEGSHPLRKTEKSSLVEL